jgi:shikimate dehydrogenase
VDGLRRLGVLGWPVAHSRSPAMHRAALAAIGRTDLTYQRLPVPPEAFAETVRALPGAGFVGANVTIPHKEAALALATEASEAAEAIGAANTLSFPGGGRIVAENTDAPGLLAALGMPAPRSALVLGAGGSARAAAYALKGAGADVAVWNRTPERARLLAADLGVTAVPGAAPPAEALVNCTAAGLADPATTFKELPVTADVLGEYAVVVDLVYRDGGTELLRAARRAGCRVVDGLEVLVHQGALSFEIWTGARAPLDVMRRAARGEHELPPPFPPAPGPRPRGRGP